MIVILKENPAEEQLNDLTQWLKSLNIEIYKSEGLHKVILGLIGDTTVVDVDLIKALDIVEDVRLIQEPYKSANRKFHPMDSIIQVGDVKIGDGSLQIIAGPCSIETEAQICSIAQSVKESGARILRGGAFKPRTSPYSFQGLRNDGIKLLLKAKKASGLPVVTEIMDLSQLELFEDVDFIQVGARNMQNFELLKELGRSQKPILLKRGLASTFREWLMSVEYIMAGGNPNVVLCERGIRTFENYTRNTLDLSAVPVIKKLSHLPIIVDPSHATGRSELIVPMALAAVAAGADGLMIEVHNDPPHALCDGPQSLLPSTFDKLMKKIQKIRVALQD
ncbi:MAG: 3-deoxy-7-phosphoheptulonate synthase [Lentisphaeria bacterium]